MKRLHPLALTVTGPDEVRLLCLPKTDQLKDQEALADLIDSLRSRAIDQPQNDLEIKAEFPFTFAENGAVQRDRQFEYLTGDDCADFSMSQAAEYLSLANEKGISFNDHPGKKAFANKLLVAENNNLEIRRYTIFFAEVQNKTFENFDFTVRGNGDKRTITWKDGSQSLTWRQRNWYCDSAVAADFELLLFAVVRMDEAINSELMP